MLFRIARRNVLRHRHRTFLTSVAIVFSYALLIVFTGLADGGHEAIADVGIRMGLGHVVVQAEGYSDNPSLDLLIKDPDTVAARLRSVGPDVDEVAVRLRVEALIQSGSTGIGVMVSGVDPEVEARVSNIASPRSIVRGTALKAHTSTFANDLPPIVVGKELAETLNVDVGDRATLTVRPAGGGDLRSAAFRICGIFETGVHEVDAFWVEIPLEAAQRFSGAEGSVTMVAALLKSIGQTDVVAEQLRGALQGDGKEVLTWAQAAPELHAAIVLDEGGMYVLIAVVFLVVAVSVLNTTLTSVLERTREFGVLLALGARRSRIVALVLTEALLLGTAAVALGLVIGLLVHYHFATAGVSLKDVFGTSFEASGVLLPDRIYSKLSLLKVGASAGTVIVLVALGALYPALRAARLEPVEAISNG